MIASDGGSDRALTAAVRRALSDLDDAMFDLWNLGENIILAWARQPLELRLLVVHHFAITDSTLAKSERKSADEAITQVLAGPKGVSQEEIERISRLFGSASRLVSVSFKLGDEIDSEMINRLVARYGVSLVRERAVVLLDAVGFSLRSPLEQVAMLNSLTHSVNSAYRQLQSKDIQINFARTTTGDGFYIWSQARTTEANIALYKLMMLILADNAVVQRKMPGFPVPKLRAAFHVSEHYEFYQMDALNPTAFGYIVGRVTIELARMVENALPGQIILGEFDVDLTDRQTGNTVRYNTLDFVDKTADELQQLKGLVIAGDSIDGFSCYVTGERQANGEFQTNSIPIRDKHGATRSVYNAKINIHLLQAEPIFLGIQHKDLKLHPAEKKAIESPQLTRPLKS
ncbi:MAG: hypothetical protein LLG15_13180 [Betaproteobacteria bacterium]|nr:hypothetical protein [Betaproteobacteria bacterium]